MYTYVPGTAVYNSARKRNQPLAIDIHTQTVSTLPDKVLHVKRIACAGRCKRVRIQHSSVSFSLMPSETPRTHKDHSGSSLFHSGRNIPPPSLENAGGRETVNRFAPRCGGTLGTVQPFHNHVAELEERLRFNRFKIMGRNSTRKGWTDTKSAGYFEERFNRFTIMRRNSRKGSTVSEA